MSHSRAVLAKQQVAAFSPSDVAGLVAWWDASALTGLSDGDPISSFTDLSGGGFHATAALSSHRPTYKTGIQNGLPVARFDGSDDFMTASLPTVATDNITQFTLAKYTSGASGVPIYVGNGGGNGWGLALKTGTDTKVGWLRGGIAWHDSTVGSSTAWRLLVGRRAAGTFNLYVEGGSPVLTTTGAPNTPTDSVNFAGHTEGALSAFDLGVGLIYAAALSDANVNLIGAYLCTKWGLTWTNL